MYAIWTNPSLNRSFIGVSNPKAELSEFLKCTIDDGSKTLKTVCIFEGFEYYFEFYDANLGNKRSVTGLVMNVYEDKIKIKCSYNREDKKKKHIRCNECERKDHCTNKNNEPMPTCNCILNPPDRDKYEDPEIIFIPLSNLMSIKYISSDRINHNREDRVMLLGISATVIKAIVLRLEFFDDQIKSSVRSIDMKIGGIYELTYERRHSIFESTAKLVQIEDNRNLNNNNNCNCGTVKPGRGFVRENIGSNNSICITPDHNHDKDNFMVEPPVEGISLVVDTSEDFSGRYETIELSALRNCVLVSEPDEDSDTGGTGDDNNTEEGNTGCGCCMNKTDGCNPPASGTLPVYTYNYDAYGQECKATLVGDEAEIVLNGEKSTVSLDELFKFYLGL